MKLLQSDFERFSQKIERIPFSGCWLWTGALKTGGYGDFWLFGKVTGAHRASYLMHKGPIPENAEVCHHCDVRCCVNPAHLFLGTWSDNMKDAANKGRLQHRGAKLTNKQADEIRRSHLPGVDLAAKFGVSQNIISRIRKGHAYAIKQTLGDFN